MKSLHTWSLYHFLNSIKHPRFAVKREQGSSLIWPRNRLSSPLLHGPLTPHSTFYDSGSVTSPRETLRGSSWQQRNGVIVVHKTIYKIVRYHVVLGFAIVFLRSNALNIICFVSSLPFEMCLCVFKLDKMSISNIWSYVTLYWKLKYNYNILGSYWDSQK